MVEVLMFPYAAVTVCFLRAYLQRIGGALRGSPRAAAAR